MKKKLQSLALRCKELEDSMSSPDIVSDQLRFKKLNQEHARLVPLITKHNKLEKAKKDLADTLELVQSEKDADMRSMLETEIESLNATISQLESELTVLLLPQDPNSGKDVILEIRAGTGGDEAALFVGDLLRMYTRYVDTKGWRLEMIDSNQSELGGYREVVFSVSGPDAYDSLKFESGGHRVQRVPATEANGRIHTSAVTVAIMAEAEETDIEIRPEDLRIDVYRSTGHGGQSVNTTDSAVRITHLPTNTVATCQDEKSQLKNKAKAMRVLRTRLFEAVDKERRAKEAEMRKTLVGSGDRSDKIRTYNFPQSRVTDHRIGLTLYSLDTFLNGDMDKIIDALKKFDVEEQLKNEVM